MNSYSFTSASVFKCHPDKFADQVSQSILDAILVQDPAVVILANTGFTATQITYRKFNISDT
jgi:S-adenosylmethionine synthetase